MKPIHEYGVEKQDMLIQMDELVQNELVPLTKQLDLETGFPHASLKALAEARFHTSLIDPSYGGLGLGISRGDIYTQWMLTKRIATADMGTSRVWEGHSNAVLFLDHLANDEQKKEWFDGICNKGQWWGAWSGEPLAPKPGQQIKIGTKLERLPGGYRLNGTKVFCSGAPGIDWAVLFVNTKGAGGVRHTQTPMSVLMMACPLNDRSISLDDSWWNPLGMESSQSLLVHFEDTFLPDEHLIGIPGQYLSEHWQTRTVPQYAATFLGGAIAAYKYTRVYVAKQRKEEDPYIQQRMARMHMAIESCELLFQHTARLWETGQLTEAILAGNSLRFQVEELTKEVVEHAIHCCGARGLIKPGVLEKVYRDLSFYVRHDNNDHVLATVGKAVLGVASDHNFHHGSEKVNTKPASITTPNKPERTTKLKEHDKENKYTLP